MAVLITSHNINASADNIWAAFADAERLARWWGPDGFTNTIKTFEFLPGGNWVYMMHGPDGRDYPNESVFREIVEREKIVIEHVVLPFYKLTITFAENNGVTTVNWEQDFENEVFATKMRDFLLTANQQNLDRLTAEVMSP